MRIVLDTNVIVAGLMNAHGAPGSILNAVLDRRVSFVVDDRILFEYRDVLRRPKFRFDLQYVESLLDYIEHRCEKVTAGPTKTGFTGPGDVAFYEVALAGDADYLVTGNLRHFPARSYIVSPVAFVSKMHANE
jgi:uncharacterized protein